MNIIAEMWLYCLLAAHKQKEGEKFISDYLKKNDDNKGVFLPINTENDFAYFWITDNKIRFSVRGTHGKDAWRSNFKFLTNNNGVHEGFCEGAMALWLAVKNIICANYKKDFEAGHHSRGSAIGQILCLWLRQDLGIWHKPMLFCPPTPWDERGDSAFTNEKLQALNIISPNDFVDNVGAGIFSGVHSGSSIYLPITKEYGKERILDRIPGWGHSYSEVTDGLIKYFRDYRGMNRESDYLESISYLATI